MFGSTILEVAIGMVFVYLLMSLICSAANEIIESVLKNRATDLERGLRELFNQKDGGHLAQIFYNHPMISGLYRGQYTRAAGKAIGFRDYLKSTNLPAYIPSRNFSSAVLDLLLHPPTEKQVPRDDAKGAGAGEMVAGASADTIQDPPGEITLSKVSRAIVERLPNAQAGRALRTLAEQSKDVEELRKNMEKWFDSAMDRVSGGYKRRTKWIIFTIGFVLTVILNVNSIEIAKTLATNNALREVIVAEAESYANRVNAANAQQGGGGSQSNANGAGTARQRFDENREALDGLGLPIGWPNGFYFVWSEGRPWKFNWWRNVFLPLIGWLMTAAAISMGAPFWFDMLNKIMVIRSTVKPNEKSPPEASEDRQLPKKDKNEVTISLKTEGATAGTPGGAGDAGGGGALGEGGGGGAVGVGDAVGGVVPKTEPTPTPEPEVAAPPAPEDEESEVDGCDVEIVDVTPDDELPPTKGGVG